MRTPAEIRAIVDSPAAAKLRRALGPTRMYEVCALCPLANCDPTSTRCAARQIRGALDRAYYAKHRKRCKTRQRQYRRKNIDRERARVREYHADPLARAIHAAQSRQRYAAQAAAQGRTVRAYRYKNKPQEPST